MFQITKHIKTHFSILLCILLTIISLIPFTNSKQSTIEVQNVSLSFDDETASFNISMLKLNKENQTETKTISMKISEFREVFPNKLSSQNFTSFPLMQQTDNKTSYQEQNITCNKINLQTDNLFSFKASNPALKLFNSTTLEVQYFLFQEPGWIDDQTNYVRAGNLMIEINLRNYTFCEDLVANYNKIIESKNANAGFDIKAFPNCKGDAWSKDEATGKFSLNENKHFNIRNASASDKNWKNKSYFEIAFELNTNDNTNYVYDDPYKVLEGLKTNNSYLRLYQSIKLDDQISYMENGFPSVSWNTESKRIVLQIPKFTNTATAWIFVDMNFIQPPANYKSFATIAFYVILVLLVLFVAYILINRKRMKEKLMMEEKMQHLSNL